MDDDNILAESTADGYARRIESALLSSSITSKPVSMAWSEGGGRKPKPIGVQELVAVMFIVSESAIINVLKGRRLVEHNVGLSIKRLSSRLACRPKKAARMLAILRHLGLIEIVGNYSAGRRGNIYRIVPVGQKARPRPKPMSPISMNTNSATTATPDDNPFV